MTCLYFYVQMASLSFLPPGQDLAQIKLYYSHFLDPSLFPPVPALVALLCLMPIQAALSSPATAPTKKGALLKGKLPGAHNKNS